MCDLSCPSTVRTIACARAHTDATPNAPTHLTPRDADGAALTAIVTLPMRIICHLFPQPQPILATTAPACPCAKGAQWTAPVSSAGATSQRHPEADAAREA